MSFQIPTDEASLYVQLEWLRWRDGQHCPHCGASAPHIFIRPRQGKARPTRTGAMTERRVWKCRDCRMQFSVLTGTIFEGTKVPLRAWLHLIAILCSDERWTYRELQSRLNVSSKTAIRMVRTIREAKRREPLLSLIRGAA